MSHSVQYPAFLIRTSSLVFNFRFTSCYDQSSTQEQIFEQDVRPLIDVVYSGVVSHFLSPQICRHHCLLPLQTVTIFAYGVTSSGKTHTMQGTKAHPGVIPRVVEVSCRVLYIRTMFTILRYRQCSFRKRLCNAAVLNWPFHTWKYTRTRFMISL